MPRCGTLACVLSLALTQLCVWGKGWGQGSFLSVPETSLTLLSEDVIALHLNLQAWAFCSNYMQRAFVRKVCNKCTLPHTAFLNSFFNTVNNTFLRCLDLRRLLVLCLKAAGISILKEQSSVSEINGRSQSILFKCRAAFPSENQVWVAC